MPGDLLYFNPHEHGSHVMLTVELYDPPGARARFLCATSGTELTQPFLPHQDRFATSTDFANHVWRDLELDPATLAATNVFQIDLTYTPVP